MSDNQAFLAEISKVDLGTPYKTQVRRMCNFMEEFQAESLMLKTELKEVKEINRCRKVRKGGKYQILKDTPVVSMEEIEKTLRKCEIAMKKGKKGKGKGKAKPVKSSDDNMDSYSDDSPDSHGPSASKIFDCIEVAS